MAYTYLCVCLVKTSVSSFCLKFGCFITKGTMCSWQVWNFLREEVLLVTSFTNGVNLWHLLLCWYPKCIFLPINYTCFGRGLFCQRISWKKKLLIHNNINYYCEHFVCNLASAAYVFGKKKIWARGHSQVCLSRIMWTGFFVKSNNICVVVKQGF